MNIFITSTKNISATHIDILNTILEFDAHFCAYVIQFHSVRSEPRSYNSVTVKYRPIFIYHKL